MRFDLDFMLLVIKEVIYKLPVNIMLATNAFALGLFLAVVITVIRFYRLRFVIKIIDFYISLARGIPLYLQIVLFFFGLPIVLKTLADALGMEFSIRHFSPAASVVAALTFNVTASLSESLRGGVAGIRRGEIEAGHSIGMTLWQILHRVVVPQSAVLCLPNFCVLFIGLVHSTTLAFGATIIEMNGQASLLADDNGRYFEAFLAAGIFFWAITLVIQKIFKLLENHFIAKTKLNHADAQ
ncbi:amino acid ABC transporter permease [Acerihabitans sp.]|uniref:amino acid ABC transporter permease n=1 Tax=Acerihabitans sp. TaxID=2811394 RepID=UPI002EDB2F13